MVGVILVVATSLICVYRRMVCCCKETPGGSDQGNGPGIPLAMPAQACNVCIPSMSGQACVLAAVRGLAVWQPPDLSAVWGFRFRVGRPKPKPKPT